MGKRILLADDSITIQKVIELTFSDEDFEVVTVGNGRLAIEKIQEVRPDLVLCDIIMPEKDGYEVCDFVKKNPTLSHVPVLLLTGAFEPFDQERAARVGCDGFLAKPFEPQALISKVKDLLSRVQAPEPAGAPEMTAPVAVPAPVAERAPAAAPEPPAASRVAPFPQPAAPEPFFIAEAEPEAPAPPAEAPTPVLSAPSLEEPDVQFIPEEPFGEPVQFAAVDESRASREATVDFGSVSPFDEYEMASFEEVVPSAIPQAPGAMPVFEAIDAGMEELLPISAEEAETLAAPNESAAPAPPEAAEAWSQPTVEVSLEERAQAGMEAAQLSPEPFFEEVFEEEPAPPAGAEVPAAPHMAVEHVLLDKEDEPLPALLDEVEPMPFESATPAPTVAARESERAEAPTPVPAAIPKEPSPPPAPTPEKAEPAPVAPREQERLEPTVAAPVSAETVSQAVTQISERIIREIAWEVIPDLAEALIKKEIERLKAELAQS